MSATLAYRIVFNSAPVQEAAASLVVRLDGGSGLVGAGSSASAHVSANARGGTVGVHAEASASAGQAGAKAFVLATTESMAGKASPAQALTLGTAANDPSELLQGVRHLVFSFGDEAGALPGRAAAKLGAGVVLATKGEGPEGTEHGLDDWLAAALARLQAVDPGAAEAKHFGVAILGGEQGIHVFRLHDGADGGGGAASALGAAQFAQAATFDLDVNLARIVLHQTDIFA